MFWDIKNDQLAKIKDDPTKCIECKIQRYACKLRRNIPKDGYSKLYPTGSNSDKFYWAVEIHKTSYKDTIDQFPFRPIVSNVGTASYHLPKYLAKLLSPISQSKYTVANFKKFIQKFKKVVSLDSNSKLVPFEVSSFFTTVLLDSTIDTILRQIYKEIEIVTIITPNELE